MRAIPKGWRVGYNPPINGDVSRKSPLYLFDDGSWGKVLSNQPLPLSLALSLHLSLNSTQSYSTVLYLPIYNAHAHGECVHVKGRALGTKGDGALLTGLCQLTKHV